MSDDSEDPPLAFPDSDTEENSGDSTSDPKPVTSYKWTPELLELFMDHGVDPDSFEDEEVDEEEEDKPENKTQEALKFRLPPPKASSRAEGDKLQLESAKKRKKSTDENEASEDSDENDSEEPEARRARKKKKKAKKARRENEVSEDSDETEEARRARKKKKRAQKKARREAEAAEAAERVKSTELLGIPVAKKRGRPPQPKDGTTTKVTPSHSFDASVFVSVEQPPEMVRGKTHRSDKLVPKKPRVEGPFTLTKSMQWTQFLDEVAECMDIDKENILLDGMTWAFQKQKEPLPLSSEQGFKTMREQVSAKGNSATVVFVYHPIFKRKAGCRGRGGPGEDDNEDNMGDMNSGYARAFGEDDSRWGKKLNLDAKLAPIIAQLQNLYPVGNCSDHSDISCFNWPFRGETWHFELNQGRLSVWANAIPQQLRKDVNYEKAPIGRNFFLPKDRLKVNGRPGVSEAPAPYPVANTFGAPNGAPSPWQVSSFLPPPTPSHYYGHHSPYISGSPGPSYYPGPFSPMSPSFPYHQGMMPQWGSPAPPQSPTSKPTTQEQPKTLQAKSSQDIQAWCSKYHLGDEECAGLSKLGFRIGQSHELMNLDASMWEWAGIPPLAKMRILAACDAEIAAA